MKTTDSAPSAAIATTQQIKIFRQGKWYQSLDSVLVPYTNHNLHLASSLMMLDDVKKSRSLVASGTVTERAALLERAMTLFTSGRVLVEGFGEQTPEDFAQLLWQALGLPDRLVSQWYGILIEQLTKELASVANITPSQGTCLVSLPANTFVCLDACFRPLLSGMNLWMRPSQREPFSVWRFLSCLLEVGWNPASLSFYPTTHATLLSVASRLEQSIIYGGDDINQLFAGKSNITVHGPGRAFAIIEQVSDQVVKQLLSKILAGAGRFCLCLGTILCENSALALGETIATLLDQVPLEPQVETKWPLAVRPDVDACERQIERIQGLMREGDRVLTQRPWLVQIGERCIPVPTLIYLDHTKDHPLLGVEVDFPLAVIGDIDPEAVKQLNSLSGFFYQLGK
jgi:hypothetical protein